MLVPPMAYGLFFRILRGEGYKVDLFDTTDYVADESVSPQNRVKFLQAREFDDADDRKVTHRTNMLGEFREVVEKYQPHLILFSVVEDVFLKTISMLEKIEDLKVPHLLGGVFPTMAPSRCFDYPIVKMIGLGEGENTVIAVSEALRCQKSLMDIPGTWYRDADSKIYKNSLPALVDINQHQPDWSLFEESRFLRPMGGRIFKSVPIETYRGCPYNCAFCNSPSQRDFSTSNELGNFLRRKKISALKDEMLANIKLYDPELFYIIDDSFLARPRDEIHEFCNMYDEIRLPFWWQSRPENCRPETLAHLKSVGCYRISFGIECGNETYRNNVLLRKPTNKDIISQFEVIADSGLPFSVNLIIGMPDETRELIMDTVELVRSLRGYDSLTVSIFVPYHGTVLRQLALKKSYIDPHTICQHTTAHSVLNMPAPYVSSSDIDGLMRVLPLYCYFPKSEWEHIGRAEIDDELGNQILSEYSTIYRHEFLKENQDQKQIKSTVVGSLACRASPKDSIRHTVIS